MKVLKYIGAVALISSALLFSGCTEQEKGLARGAAAGVIVGSLINSASDHKSSGRYDRRYSRRYNNCMRRHGYSRYIRSTCARRARNYARR